MPKFLLLVVAVVAVAHIGVAVVVQVASYIQRVKP